jgi:LPS O-antigen subunit length determinant protein (WzzB/FepE family)
MRQALQNITEDVKIKDEILMNKKKEKIEKEKYYLKEQIFFKLDIEDLKDAIKNAHSKGLTEIVIIPQLIIENDSILIPNKFGKMKCFCPKGYKHLKETCDVMKIVEDICLSKMDKNEFDIKMDFRGKIIDNDNEYIQIWRIYLEFGL